MTHADALAAATVPTAPAQSVPPCPKGWHMVKDSELNRIIRERIKEARAGIEVAALACRATGNDRYLVASASEPGTSYAAALIQPAGMAPWWECNCTYGQRLQPGDSATCRHVRRAQLERAREQKRTDAAE